MDHTERQSEEFQERRKFLKTAAITLPAVTLLVSASAKKASAQVYGPPTNPLT